MDGSSSIAIAKAFLREQLAELEKIKYFQVAIRDDRTGQLDVRSFYYDAHMQDVEISKIMEEGGVTIITTSVSEAT